MDVALSIIQKWKKVGNSKKNSSFPTSTFFYDPLKWLFSIIFGQGRP